MPALQIPCNAFLPLSIFYCPGWGSCLLSPTDPALHAAVAEYLFRSIIHRRWTKWLFYKHNKRAGEWQLRSCPRLTAQCFSIWLSDTVLPGHAFVQRSTALLLINRQQGDLVSYLNSSKTFFCFYQNLPKHIPQVYLNASICCREDLSTSISQLCFSFLAVICRVFALCCRSNDGCNVMLSTRQNSLRLRCSCFYRNVISSHPARAICVFSHGGEPISLPIFSLPLWMRWAESQKGKCLGSQMRRENIFRFNIISWDSLWHYEQSGNY